jgi:hypothetical protein
MGPELPIASQNPASRQMAKLEREKVTLRLCLEMFSVWRGKINEYLEMFYVLIPNIRILLGSLSLSKPKQNLFKKKNCSYLCIS